MKAQAVLGCIWLAAGFAVGISVYAGSPPATAQFLANGQRSGYAVLAAAATLTPQRTETVIGSSATPSATVKPSALQFAWDDRDSLVWQTPPNAATYLLTGAVYAIRANAVSPFCVAPLSQEAQSITLNETLNGSSTSFRIVLPSLPPVDMWFVPGAQADLRAVDANGVTIASEHVGFIYETFCSIPDTQFPELKPPNAGVGSTSRGDARSLAIALGSCGVALLVTGLRRSWRDT
jgi:hypothetical protein